MGNCCGQDQGNTLELHLSHKNNMNDKEKAERSKKGFNSYRYGERSSLLKNKESINFEVEKNNFTLLINDLISRHNFIDIEYSTRESRLHKERFVERLRSDQLFNIIISHKNDFTNSDYVFYDLRINKKETYIKVAKHLNYLVKELQIASTSIIKKIKKFLHGKKLIVLIDKTDSIVEVEELLVFLSRNEFNCKVKLLDTDLNKEASLSTNAISGFLDKRIGRHLPYIFANLQHYQHLGSNKFVFLNYNFSIEEFFSKEKESNMFTCVPDIHNFIEFFNLNVFVLFTADNDIIKRIYNLHDKIIYLSQSILIDSVSSKEKVASKASEILDSISRMLCAIDDENSGLILIDKNIKPEVLNLLMYILIRKLFKVPVRIINTILQDNPIFYKNFIESFDRNQEEMEEFVIKNFDVLEKSVLEKSVNKTDLNENMSELMHDLENKVSQINIYYY
jgi:hypothetical protein